MRAPPTDEEAAFMRQRAEELFEKVISAKLDHSRPDDYLAIDVESGDYEVDEKQLSAVHRLRDRRPDALVWLRKVGSPYARRARTHIGRRIP